MYLESWLRVTFDKVVDSKNDYRVDCPFCINPDTKQHLYISKSKHAVHCFRCEWSGSYFSLVREVTGAESYAEILRHIKQPQSTTIDFQPIVDRLQLRLRGISSDATQDMPSWYRAFEDGANCKQAKLVLRYALKRTTADNIVRFRLGYCAVSGIAYSMRLIIPVEGKYYQARAIYDNCNQKYINPESDLDGVLFNHRALDEYDKIFICEGAFSAMAIGHNAIATLGKRATSEQLLRLKRAPVGTYIIAYDAGVERSEKALELADYLSASGKNVIMRQYLEGDPDSSDVYQEYEYDLTYRAFSMFS